MGPNHKVSVMRTLVRKYFWANSLLYPPRKMIDSQLIALPFKNLFRKENKLRETT